MREILFRGMRKDNGDWVFGDLSFHKDGRIYIRCWDRLEYCPAYNAYEVDSATIGQFTGLTDKNGKMIFEGDIAKGLFLFGLEVRSVVAFQDGAFGLEWNRGKAKNFSAFTSICNVTYEVIGNIHDNPELMEVRDGN